MKKFIWYTILIVSAISFVVLIFVFYRALKNSSSMDIESKATIAETKSTNNSIKLKNSNAINILIIGDSVAKGTGDEEGNGFSTYLPEQISHLTSKSVTVNNIGIDGLRSNGLIESLEGGKVSSLIDNSDYILLSIGGNDIRYIQKLSYNEKSAIFDGLQNEYLLNLREFIKLVREKNSETLIILLGLYNPSENGKVSEETIYINTWNYHTQQVADLDVNSIFIPVYDMIKFNVKRYISNDGIHPDSEGYRAMTKRIVDSITGKIIGGS